LWESGSGSGGEGYGGLRHGLVAVFELRRERLYHAALDSRMLRSTTTKYTGLLDSRKRVCARSYETCRPFFLCFLVLSPAFADVVSVIRVWLHHARIREPVVLAGSRSQLHAWTDATKLARRSAWKKLQLQRLFCLFSILLYAKIVNPRYIFFAAYQVIPYAKSETHSASLSRRDKCLASNCATDSSPRISM